MRSVGLTLVTSGSLKFVLENANTPIYFKGRVFECASCRKNIWPRNNVNHKWQCKSIEDNTNDDGVWVKLGISIRDRIRKKQIQKKRHDLLHGRNGGGRYMLKGR